MVEDHRHGDPWLSDTDAAFLKIAAGGETTHSGC